ncbi:MAG TPA: Rne/Rng family ribonuclease [Thermoanaerobaculia bacterium]|nr:Rne/Rng family ribonuclease [Thermoanaerobaculia bacterium]
MLINAQNSEELRIAVVQGTTLETFQVEVAERGLTRGNVYRGTVVNVQPALNAAFIEYGAERHGFLSLQDIVPEVWHRSPAKERRPRIEEVLDKGKPIIVQVSKEPEGQKGAGLTTNLSFAGRYLVLTPYDDTRGVSRKVEDDEVRRQLKDQVEKLKVPDGAGFIVRTNALDQNKTTLTRDFAALIRLWKKIQVDSKKGKGPRLLYSDQDIILRTLRDYLDASIEEVLIDDEESFEKASEYVKSFLPPRGKTRLVRYADRAPLFSRYDLDTQIDRIYERSVPLPSGGSIVIDRTEALVAIDVNSGRSTRAGNQEETAHRTNLEAAEEVARHLRLRDIGGLVVVDFIDMRNRKNQTSIEKTLRDAMKTDKARFTVGSISPNGLLEINRQRIQQALNLRTHRSCPTCDGTGRIASPEMVGLNLLRRIETRATTNPISRVRIALHPELADAFQNGRRQEIAALEREFDIHIEVIASNRLHRPDQEVEWFAREKEQVAQKEQSKAAPTKQQTAVDEIPKAQQPPAQQPPKAAPAPPPQAPASESDQLSAGSESDAPKRSRRRRRRRGKDSHASVANGAPSASEEASVPDVEPAESPAAAAQDPTASAELRPKKKRPRRRGRKRGHGENPAPSDTSEAKDTARDEDDEQAGSDGLGSDFWVIL